MKNTTIRILMLGILAWLHHPLLFAQSVASGQSSNAAINISANNTPVTLYTGKPNIAIPLHNINADGIQIPISLSYNASGIKVEQLASQVGLGWTLNAGGVITREMRGYPDEMLGEPGQSNAYKPIGYLYHGIYTDDLWDNPINGENALTKNYTPISYIDPKTGVRKVVRYERANGYSSHLPVNGYNDEEESNYTLKKDTEADIYHFNFGRYSGRFTFDSEGMPKLLNDDKDLKIEYKLATGYVGPDIPHGMSHIISRNLGLLEWFKITTANGTTYTFDKHEIQMTFSPGSQNGISFPESPDDRCLGDRAYLDEDLTSHHVSAWYLTKIENGVSAVSLAYNEQIETNHTTSQQLFSGHSEMIHKYTITEVPVLSFISWNGSQSVSFRRSSARKDFYYPNTTLASRRARALDEILISDQAEPYDQNFQVFKKIDLTYDYFNKTGVSPSSSCTNSPDIIKAHEERLKLLSVTFTENWGDGTSKVFPPYEFEYDETALPVRHSNRKDLWGYFNGSQPGSYDLSPKQWEYPADQAHKNTFLTQYSPIPYDNYTTGQQYIVNGEERPVYVNAAKAGILKRIIFPTGGYTSYEYESNEFTTPAHNNPIKGGGLRIKKIIKSNGINELSENAVIKNYAYEDEYGNKVPGKLQMWPSFSHTDPFLNSTNFSTIYSSSGSGNYTTSHASGSSANVLYPSVVVREAGGKGKTVYTYDIPVGFDTDNKDYWNGEYVYNRTVSSIFSNHNQASNSPYAPNPNYGWRVALTEKKVYNESNTLLQKTVNEYEIAKAEKLKRIKFRFFSRMGLRQGSPSIGTIVNINGVTYQYMVNPPDQPINNHEYAKYYDISGWYRLKQSTVYSYDETNPAIAVAKKNTFNYGTNHKLVTEKRVLNSDGTTYIVRNKFPFDYSVSTASTNPTTSAILEMKNQFRNNFPIESITLKEPSGQTAAVIAGELIKPVISPLTGGVVAGESWAIQTQLPIINFNTSHVNSSGGFVIDNNYERQAITEAYNNRNLPIQIKQEYAQPSAIIWQTESPYLPIAEALSTSRSDIGVVSFEQPVFHAQWDISQNGSNAIVAGGHTGSSHYEMRTEFGAGGVFKVSDQSGKYKASAWIKSAGGVNLVLTTRRRDIVGIYPASGPVYQQTNSGNTNGKWQLVEVEIDLAAIQAANGSLSLMDVHFYLWNPAQQLVLIDDIRFSPSDSPIHTSVYNDRGYLVAGFDHNNRKITSEYTAEGKLLHIKNEDGDILSANEYHISSNPLNPSYQKSVRVRTQGKKTAQDVDYLGYNSLDEWSTSISYFDGMRRPVQQIAIDASPAREDIIKPIVYENYGQKLKNYLPYADGTGVGGTYRNQAVNDQGNFYLYEYQDVNSFTSFTYNESPFNQVKSIRPMGNQFASQPANQLLTTTFKTNASGEVYLLDGLISNGFYHVASLFVIEYQDFKGNKSWRYMDAIGRTIMLKQEAEGGEFAKTYYAYTPKGELYAIIPPEQTKELEANNWTLAALQQLMTPKNQLYLYEYDDRGRLTLKWTPESKEEFVYDRLDRLVLSNDAELKKNNKWRFTKYDQFGRSVYQGLYTHTNAGIPGISNTGALNESKQSGTTHGYSNLAFPDVNTEILSVFYYDNYDVTGDGIADVSFSPVLTGNYGSGWPGLNEGRTTVSKRLFGFPTFAKVALLDNSGTMLENAVFYNRYGHVIQLSGDNHLGGRDQFDYITDFEGKVRERRQHHTIGSGSTPQIILEAFQYDHEGRLLNQTHQINNGLVVTLKSNEYGSLGELKETGLHKIGGGTFLEKIGFVYDVLGRTTFINTSAGSGFFKENITYDLNSNVASTRFQMPVRNPNGKVDMCPSCPNVNVYTHQYDFTYDKMNRLTSADHNIELLFTGNFVPTQYPGRYSVNDISYNLNSDILTLNRNGFLGYSLDPYASTRTTIADFGSMDALSYTYHEGRLVGVSDAARSDIGFTEVSGAMGAVNVFNAATHEYQYNDNGHLIKDKNKGINQIAYNHLNLATSMQMDGGTNRLDWLYIATGQKLRKTSTSAGVPFVKDYVGIFEYTNNSLESIRTDAGRVVYDGTGFSYEYVIKDHQGNSRITFSDLDNNGMLTVYEILQQNHYYPFGMRMNAIDNRYAGIKNLYQYRDKEKQEEFGLNLSDFGPRYYDGSIGRWHAPDIMNEKYHTVSGYNYVLNNPLTLSDPSGMQPVNTRGEYADDWRDDRRDEWDRGDENYQDDYFNDFMDENHLEELGDGSSFYDQVDPEDPPNDALWFTIRNKLTNSGFDLDGFHRFNRVGEYAGVGLTYASVGGSVALEFSKNRVPLLFIYSTFTNVNINNLSSTMSRWSTIGTIGKYGGRFFGFMSITSSGIQYLDGEISGFQFSLDTFMTGVGMFGGPKGAIASGVYFFAVKPLYFYFFPAPSILPENYIYPSDVWGSSNDWENMTPITPIIDSMDDALNR